MKILILCHRFPLPAEGGGKIRALHMIRHFASRGHDVTLASLTRSAAEAASVADLEKIGVRVVAAPVSEPVQVLRMLWAMCGPQSCSFSYFYSPELASRVRALLDEEAWDLILVHCSSMGPYAVGARAPKIMDFCDMDSQKLLDYARERNPLFKWVYAIEGRKLEREEARLARSYDVSTTISRGELQTLARLAPEAPAAWFPNGVDLEYFTPSAEPHDPSSIVFVGRMDYYPNEQAMRWFCDEVWPALRARHPGLSLKIVGANPPKAVRGLSLIDGVEVTGTVPDVRPHVRPAAASVAPLMIARGLQNKVLECMAMGVPVVTTTRVADGLGAEGESPLLVADSAEAYVEALDALLKDPRQRSERAAASRALVESQYSWDHAMRKLEAIIASLQAARCEPSAARISAASGPRA